MKFFNNVPPLCFKFKLQVMINIDFVSNFIFITAFYIKPELDVPKNTE